jgi:hypothetical protein
VRDGSARAVNPAGFRGHKSPVRTSSPTMVSLPPAKQSNIADHELNVLSAYNTLFRLILGSFETFRI